MVNGESDTKKLLIGFIGIIVAIVMLAASADSVSTQTTTFNTENASITIGAINSTSAITGRNLIGTTYQIYNESNDIQWGNASNTSFFTIETGIVGGLQSVTILVDQNASTLVGDTVNVTYEYADSGYINDGGGRSIANLIVLIAAIAILVFSLMLIFSSNAGQNLLRGFS